MRVATITAMVSSMILASSLLAMTASAWTLPFSSTQASSPMSRSDLFQQTLKGGAATLLVGTFLGTTTVVNAAEPLTTASGVTYEILKQGDGPKPEIGELVAIRFAAYVAATGNKIDDIFDTPEPYYTRMGSGGLLKGVETTLPLMRLGDRWKLTIPGDLAFGSKGRPASAGKPRIPADSVIVFDVEMVGLPGKEPELIDLIGDD